MRDREKQKIAKQRWAKNNPEKIKKSQLKYKLNHPDELKKKANERVKKYRQLHPERCKLSRKKYYSNPENKEKIKIARRIYREKNREKIKKAKREWVLKNQEHLREYKQTNNWNKENPEKALENKRNWQKKNKDKLMEERIRRRARKLGAEGSFTNGEWELLKKQYGCICPCCGKSEPQIKLTADHIIPLTKGGSNWIENIQPLCQPCNSRKYTKIIKFNPQPSPLPSGAGMVLAEKVESLAK